MYSSFSTKSSGNSYKSLCLSLITQLSQRVLKTLKNEYTDDTKFALSLINIHQKLVEMELESLRLMKTSEAIQDLVNYCKRKVSLRSNSNDRVSYKRIVNEKVSTARGSNFSKLDRIVEESPNNLRVLRKDGKKVKKKTDGVHAYYQSMMGKYLKMTLKSPIKGSKPEGNSRAQVSQVQLKDGMFFRLF